MTQQIRWVCATLCDCVVYACNKVKKSPIIIFLWCLFLQSGLPERVRVGQPARSPGPGVKSKVIYSPELKAAI